MRFDRFHGLKICFDMHRCLRIFFVSAFSQVIIDKRKTMKKIGITGCTASSGPEISRTPDFALGKSDGCQTASGMYTKNSELFRNNKEYHDGWFYGRKKCNPADSRK